MGPLTTESMFTGLVEAVGKVTCIEPRGEQARLEIEVPFVADLQPGESVAVNGCCLTVVAHDASTAAFDVLTQTLNVTSLGSLRTGRLVNLERALQAGDRFGGHFVQGHVDDTGIIEALEPKGQDHQLDIRVPQEIARLCIDKGSVAIDGISLTIAELNDDLARFWIIPHTFKQTNLSDLQVGMLVNLEADMLAKHVAKLMAHHTSRPGREG